MMSALMVPKKICFAAAPPPYRRSNLMSHPLHLLMEPRAKRESLNRDENAQTCCAKSIAAKCSFSLL